MQLTDFLSSSSTLLHHQQPSEIPSVFPCPKKPSVVITAASCGSNSSSNRGSNSKGRDYGGRLVDENMIMLRMRIREIKLSETSNEQLPSHWMDWEKKYYVDYNKDVCETMGLLQNYLMDKRPSFTLGMIALAMLCAFLSSGVAMIHAIEIARMILSGSSLS